MSFNPSRLVIARHRRKLTAKALAEKAGLTAVTISRLENPKGEGAEPEAETISSLAKALDYPEAFFYGDDLDVVKEEAVSFRALTKRTAKEINAAKAAGSLSFSLSDYVESEFNLPEYDHIPLPNDCDPRTAASVVRAAWGIGESPIPDMIKLLESKGVRVFSLCEDTKSIDAFSTWRGDTPFVFLNTIKTAERSRFDAAHELGHIVLHRHGSYRGREVEREADEFASYFLIPPKDLMSQLNRNISFEYILKAKKRWGVSAAALAYRLHKEGFLTDWSYRQFCIYLAQNYKDSEPDGMAREYSTLLDKVLRELWRLGITPTDVSEKTSIPTDELASLVFGLMKAPVPVTPSSATNRLTLVK